MKLPTAIYGRTSKDDRRKVTIEIQQKKLRAWSVSDPHVASIVGEYWDDGVSGKVPLWDRPAGASLLADVAAAGSVRAVAAVFIDRLGRTTLDSLQAAARLETAGVKLVAIEDGWDARRNDDPLYYQIRAAIAEAEWRRIKQRTEDGRVRAALRDNAPPGGSLIFGYRMTANGQFIVDPVEATIVRQVFRMAADGASHSAILAWLQSTGIAPGRKTQKRSGTSQIIPSHSAAQWRLPRIGKMLRQSAYTGERVYGGRSYPIPQIIDRDLWDCVQATNQMYTRRRGHGMSKGLLSGLLICPCGRKWYHKSDSRWKPCYVCSAGGRGYCGASGVRVEIVDREIWALVREHHEDPAAILRRASAVCGSAEETLDDLEAEERRIDAALVEIEVEVRAVWDEQAAHGWPFAWVAPRLDALNARRNTLAGELAGIRSRRAAVRLDRDTVEDILTESMGLLVETAFADDVWKRGLVRRYVAAVEMTSKSECVVHWRWGDRHAVKFPGTCTTESDRVTLRIPLTLPRR